MKKSGLADSPFFAPRSSEPTGAEEPVTTSDPERFSERKTVRTEVRTENRTAALPIKRQTKRYSFEFYEDQLARLRQLKYQADLAGERLSQSDLVREAVDLYLKDKEG